MAHIETRVAATVPKLHGRAAMPQRAWGEGLARLARSGAVALVGAGLAATAAWAGFLAWCLFSLIRWALT